MGWRRRISNMREAFRFSVPTASTLLMWDGRKASLVGFLDGKRLDGDKFPGAWRDVAFAEEIKFSPDSQRLPHVLGWRGQAYWDGRATGATRWEIYARHV